MPTQPRYDGATATLVYNNRMTILAKKVKNWGREKGINDANAQFAKMIEECGELAHELTRGNYNSKLTEDAIGDIRVCLIILADILGYDDEDCLELAWREIKDRKGKTVNGNFVKE